MANQYTTEERLQMARRLQEQRAKRLGYTPTNTDLSYYLPRDTANIPVAAKPLSQQVRGAVSNEEKDAAWYDRAGATVLDIGAKLGVGAFSALEGIYDIGAGLVGEIGGWFSEDFKRAVDEHTAYDASGNLEKTLDDLGLKHSYLNEDGVLGFADDVIGAVGGMLPAVAVSAAITAATEGAGAPVALGMTGEQLASLGTMAAGAAGQSMEEAQNEGADLGKALNYGLVSGAIEAGTEKLTGGLTKGLFGKGMLDGGEEIAKTGAKRIFKGMVEEGVEEGIASVVSPLAKTTYKGTEAHKEYLEPEFVGNVLRDMATGAVTAAAYGATVGKITHTSGKDADISASSESVSELQKKRRTLQAEGKLGEAEKTQINESVKANLDNVSKALKKASDAERQKLIKRHSLENAFDESGEIKPEFAAKMYGGATSGTMGLKNGGRGLDERYYSADMYGDEQRVANDIQKVSERLGSEVVPYSGELTETEEQNMRSLYSAANVLSDHSVTGVGVAIVDSGGKMNGAVLSDSNIIMIDKAKLSDGTWADALVHEMTHFSEGSKSYSKLMTFLAKDTELVDNVLNQIAGEGSGYGFTADTVKSFVEKSRSGEALTEDERNLRDELGAHLSAQVLGTESFMQKVIKGDVSLAEKIINRIQALSDAFSKSDSPEVRAQKKRLAKAEKLWMKAVDEAGYKYVGNKIIAAIEDEEEDVTRINEEKVQVGEKAQFSLKVTRKDGTEEIVNPFEVTREQTLELMRLARQGKLKNNTYFPVSPITPKTLILSIKDVAEKNGMTIDDRPLAMQADKARQSQIDAEPLHKNGCVIRFHAMTAEKVLEVIDNLDNPVAIIHQRNRTKTDVIDGEKYVKDLPDNFAIFVKLHDEKEYVAIIEFDATIPKDYIVEDGNGEKYHTTVTVFEPDVVRNGEPFDYIEYLLLRGDNEEVDIVKENPKSEVAIRQTEATTSSKEFSNVIVPQSSSKDNPPEQKTSGKVSTTTKSGFSLPSKQNADRNQSKTYTREDAKAIAVDNYTEKQYNDFGWAYEENALSGGKRDDFHSKFAQVVKGRVSAPKTKNGEYMIAVSDIYDSDMEGINNTIVYAKGSIESPEITRVLDIDEYEETILDQWRRELYATERRGIQQEAGGIFRFHYPANRGFERYRQRNSTKENRNNSQLGVRRGGSGKETRRLKEVRFDEDGNEISRTYFEDKAQFSLSSKPNSEEEAERKWDARAVAQALLKDMRREKAESEESNKPQKFYTRNEVAAVVDAIVSEQLQFGERYGVIDFTTKRNIVKSAWEKLNTARTDAERKSIASDIATYITDSTVAQKALSKEDSTYLAAAKQIMRKLDLDGIKPDIKERLGANTAVYAVWGKRKNGETISIAEAEKIFEVSGIEIKAASDADIFFEIIDKYKDIKERIKQESEILSAALPPQEIERVRESIAAEVLSFAENEGGEVNFSRMVESYERKVNKLKKRLDESKTSAKFIREIVFRANRLKDVKLGKTHYVNEFNDPTFRDSIGKLSGVARGGQLSATKAREACKEVYGWMGWADRLLEDASPDVIDRYDLPGVRKMLEEISRGSGVLNTTELMQLSHVIGTLTNFVETYNKIYRSGRYIEATDVAKAYIKNVERSNRLSLGMIRRFFESGFMGSYSDPATLMRFADKYKEGFFTETYDEFREGAINVAITRMELTESYRAFMDKHKDYANRLEETIELRGQQIPVGVAISLWMTSKREQSWLGLAKSGAQYRLDPKDKKAKKAANGIKIFDIPHVAENPEAYNKDNVKDLAPVMQQLRADIEAKLNEADRAYIKMAERTFAECGDIKMAMDMKRMGRTNVDKEQYYYPIARANKATTIDTESWMEGLDRVSHLSMNKDTVEGASGRLYIGSVNDVLTRHVNQVSLYNGIALAVDNFNVLVNLNTSLNRGAPVSVNTEASRTDYGKRAIDYLREMKKDIEQVRNTDLSEQWLNKSLSFLRGAYASYQLGANPKVWVTQTSSFIAAMDILDADCIAKGFAVHEEKKKTPVKTGEAERAAALRKQRITPVEIKIADGFDVGFEALERNQWNVVRKPLIQKLRELGFLKSYQTDSIDVAFEFTGESLRKSMNSQVSDYGGSLGDLAKVAMNLQPLLDSAVLIESHPDKAKGTPKENAQLVQTYVLLSAYTEGNTVTPVQFEVKQYVDDQNRLYLAVALTKIKKTGVIDDTILENQASTRLLPVSDISIARLIENINPADENFFKYIPSELLNGAQLGAKKRALEKEARKYGKDPEEYLREHFGKSESEVDKYCPLAKLRNLDNTAYEAQSVSAKVRGKVSEVLMKPIGKTDRLVIQGLWGACQAQVEKNHKGDDSMKIGTEANKVEAGKLLQKVILETQQNSIATERSAAMRSDNEIQKTVTMFSADAMKVIGRMFDAMGERATIKQELRRKDLTAEERKKLEAQFKSAGKRLRRAISVMLVQAAFMAAVAWAFNAMLSKFRDKEPDEIAKEVLADGVGNLLGGLPWVRDVYDFAFHGYELDSYVFSSVNDLLSATIDTVTLVPDLMSGKKDGKDAAKAVRSAFYAGGQVLGIPTRNMYKYVTGLTTTLFPDAGYAIDSVFNHKSYGADLEKAIEKGDERMISMISALITDEGYPNQSKETKETLRDLVSKGYVVLPRSVGDTVTVNGESVELTDAQKKTFQKVYEISDKAVEDLVKLKMFSDATDEEKAKALRRVYDLYYNLAMDHALELETEERSVLFAEALDVELLAIISARAGELKADVDKNGKAISGSRKAKVTRLVASLNLTATEKYMVMGFLGYKQTHGANQVRAYINRLSLSQKEKTKLFEYCGYGQKTA